ncbi:hypothetical protein OIU76_017406 [Salix suchowensis]|nr:hypothetical protein OIU76_017406 [Salix suchowensis]
MCNVHLRKTHNRKPQRHYISIPTVAAEFWLLQLNFAEITRSQLVVIHIFKILALKVKLKSSWPVRLPNTPVQESE